MSPLPSGEPPFISVDGVPQNKDSLESAWHTGNEIKPASLANPSKPAGKTTLIVISTPATTWVFGSAAVFIHKADR